MRGFLIVLALSVVAGCATLDPEIDKIVSNGATVPSTLSKVQAQQCFKAAQFMNEAEMTSSSFSPLITLKVSRDLQTSFHEAANLVAAQPRVYLLRYELKERFVLQSKEGELACIGYLKNGRVVPVSGFGIIRSSKAIRSEYDVAVQRFWMTLSGRENHLTPLGF